MSNNQHDMYQTRRLLMQEGGASLSDDRVVQAAKEACRDHARVFSDPSDLFTFMRGWVAGHLGSRDAEKPYRQALRVAADELWKEVHGR